MTLQATVATGLVIAVALASAGLLAGCGSGSSDSTTSAAVTEQQGSAKPSASKQGDGSEPSAEFAGKGKNGELAEAGVESSVAEREAVSPIVEASFDAAAAGEWQAQCETFSAELIKAIEESSALAGRSSCEKTVERLARENNGPPENPMAKPLAALRVNGNRAFAFFFGPEERHFVIPLTRESGEWKLAALIPEETP